MTRGKDSFSSMSVNVEGGGVLFAFLYYGGEGGEKTQVRSTERGSSGKGRRNCFSCGLVEKNGGTAGSGRWGREEG